MKRQTCFILYRELKMVNLSCSRRGAFVVLTSVLLLSLVSLPNVVPAGQANPLPVFESQPRQITLGYRNFGQSALSRILQKRRISIKLPIHHQLISSVRTSNNTSFASFSRLGRQFLPEQRRTSQTRFTENIFLQTVTASLNPRNSEHDSRLDSNHHFKPLPNKTTALVKKILRKEEKTRQVEQIIKVLRSKSIRSLS